MPADSNSGPARRFALLSLGLGTWWAIIIMIVIIVNISGNDNNARPCVAWGSLR